MTTKREKRAAKNEATVAKALDRVTAAPWSDQDRKHAASLVLVMHQQGASVHRMAERTGATTSSITDFLRTRDPALLVRDDVKIAFNRLLRREGMGTVKPIVVEMSEARALERRQHRRQKRNAPG